MEDDENIEELEKKIKELEEEEKKKEAALKDTEEKIEEIGKQMEEDGLSRDMATEDAGGEEGRAAIGVRAPARVTKEEIEEHERTRTPYRPWCRYCVRARGRNDPHRKTR